MTSRDEAAAERAAARREREEARAESWGERIEAWGERIEAWGEQAEAWAERVEAGEVPEPPWWTSDKRKTARSALSRDDIVDAAFRVLDRHGLDGLSMRRVAEELDVGAASLYWHVANKNQLINIL
jgi:hypothetical protein